MIRKLIFLDQETKLLNPQLSVVFCVTDIFGHDHDNGKTSQSRTVTRNRDREIRHHA